MGVEAEPGHLHTVHHESVEEQRFDLAIQMLGGNIQSALFRRRLLHCLRS
jgi:hypothetical protein